MVAPCAHGIRVDAFGTNEGTYSQGAITIVMELGSQKTLRGLFLLRQEEETMCLFGRVEGGKIEEKGRRRGIRLLLLCQGKKGENHRGQKVGETGG